MNTDVLIRKYNKFTDESALMQMILDEEGWDYADASMAEKYKWTLESSITYVAYIENELCGYSRSLDDFGTYIYVCDLLVKPSFRGRDIGKIPLKYLSSFLGIAPQSLSRIRKNIKKQFELTYVNRVCLKITDFCIVF